MKKDPWVVAVWNILLPFFFPVIFLSTSCWCMLPFHGLVTNRNIEVRRPPFLITIKMNCWVQQRGWSSIHKYVNHKLMHLKVHLSRKILVIHLRAVKKSLDNPLYYVIGNFYLPLLRILYKSWNDIQITNYEFLNAI